MAAAYNPNWSAPPPPPGMAPPPAAVGSQLHQARERRAYHAQDVTPAHKLAKPKYDPDSNKMAPKPKPAQDDMASDILSMIDSVGEFLDTNALQLFYALGMTVSVMMVLWSILLLRLSCTARYESFSPPVTCGIYRSVLWYGGSLFVLLLTIPFIVPFFRNLHKELQQHSEHRGLAVRAAYRRAVRQYALWQEDLSYRVKVNLGMRATRPPRVNSI